MKIKNYIYIVIGIFCLACGSSDSENSATSHHQSTGGHTITISISNTLAEQTNYALEKLRVVLASQGKTLLLTEKTVDADLLIHLVAQKSSEPNDGYRLESQSTAYQLSAEHYRGVLYALLDIVEKLNTGSSWQNLGDTTIDAHYPFRAIKFNLPWYSYRTGENLQLHMTTARDLVFWESFLDMMVENKFNTLTLWNLHPYMYMVKAKSFDKASPFSDQEMKEWKTFWQSLFKMTKQRGIDSYIFNWNIFVSKRFSEEYKIADYAEKPGKGFWGTGDTNPLIEQYMREMVSQTIDEYPNLTGIGITLGERMGGMTSVERRDWADRTLIAGLKQAKRKARLFYRAPLSAGKTSHGTVSVSAEKLTRETIETMNMDDNVWVGFKFNWSHGHSSPKLELVHGGMLTDTYWTPPSDKYKAIWTVRNEDFFVHRWGQSDFVRDFIKYNSQAYVGGTIIGSETYIPAKDYITRDEHRNWDYAFQRQWLFYKIWGNLLYNANKKDSYFEKALAKKFSLGNGKTLLKAWKLASENAHRFSSFFRGTWDATIYTEGFKTIKGGFIDINKFVVHPVLDKAYVNISDYVDGNYNSSQHITPLQLADLTKKESQEALKLVKELRASQPSKALDIELTDIEFWANYGFYFANKIRAGVALVTFRKNADTSAQKQALVYLEEALENWLTIVKLVERYNVAEMPHQFDARFSWRKHIKDVKEDIHIVRNNIETTDKIDLR